MAAAGRLGKPLLTWTVDSPADLHRGLELGVNAGGPKNGAGRGKELLMSISADMDCTSGQLEAYKRSLPLPAWQHLLLGPRLQSAPSCPAHVHLPLCAAVCCSGVQRPARAALCSDGLARPLQRPPRQCRGHWLALRLGWPESKRSNGSCRSTLPTNAARDL